MLSQLHIENIAIIEKIDISFKKGLNILTGETGTGKSIIIDSINVILGERASRELIRAGQKQALVQALFIVTSEEVEKALVDMGVLLEEDKSLLISREITTGTKNICRINGRIVTASMLKEIGGLLINIHGQHDNQDLLQRDKHICFLDGYIGDESFDIQSKYSQIYQNVNSIKADIFRISGDEKERERKIDLLQFQLDEISKAKLKKGEDEILKNEGLRISNIQKIVDAVSNSYMVLYSGNRQGFSAYDSISEAVKNIGDVEKYDEKLQKYYQSLEGIYYELEEVSHELKDYCDRNEYDPNLMDEIEQRLDLIYRLKRKYGDSIEEILEYEKKIQSELEEIINSQEYIEELYKKLTSETKKLENFAEQLHKIRKGKALKLEKSVVHQLKDLNMDKIQFKVQMDKMIARDGTYQYTDSGYDRVEFLISTNPGEPLKPLVKVASGGEMSRIMLALKTILADEVDTLVFDEIDIGVSGRAAQKIAEKLSNIAYNKQVLCITHLPQIASMADQHFVIEKTMVKGRSIAKIHKLTINDRKKELARIIGGAEITDLTLKHAEEMLNIANKVKLS